MVVGSVQNTPPVPSEQAKGVVQHYYASVNNKNYQEAYGLVEMGGKRSIICDI